MDRLVIIVGMLSLGLVACVSIPPQAVTSQELALTGVESAYRNQVSLINAYADDEIDKIRYLMEKVAIDDVIESQLNGRSALPPGEVKELIIEYSKDMNEQIAVVEKRRGELLKVANENYAEIIELTKTNLEFIKSATKATERQQTLLENYKKQQKAIEEKIKELISAEE